jgi:predicted MFS family arabinose efflux permease
MDVVPFSLFMALQSVTNVIAAIVVAKIYTDEQALRFIRFTPIYLLVCMAFLVTATLIAGLAPLWTVIALSFIGSNLISVAASFYVVGKNTMIQKRVVKERQSRVFSINRVTGLVAMPVGNFIYGLVVEGFGVLAALALTCVGVVCMFAIVRPLRLAMLKKPGEGQGG